MDKMELKENRKKRGFINRFYMKHWDTCQLIRAYFAIPFFWIMYLWDEGVIFS